MQSDLNRNYLPLVARADHRAEREPIGEVERIADFAGLKLRATSGCRWSTYFVAINFSRSHWIYLSIRNGDESRAIVAR